MHGRRAVLCLSVCARRKQLPVPMMALRLSHPGAALIRTPWHLLLGCTSVTLQSWLACCGRLDGACITGSLDGACVTRSARFPAIGWMQGGPTNPGVTYTDWRTCCLWGCPNVRPCDNTATAVAHPKGAEHHTSGPTGHEASILISASMPEEAACSGFDRASITLCLHL